MCGNYSREKTIQGQKLYEEIRYVILAMLILNKRVSTEALNRRLDNRQSSFFKGLSSNC